MSKYIIIGAIFLSIYTGYRIGKVSVRPVVITEKDTTVVRQVDTLVLIDTLPLVSLDTVYLDTTRYEIPVFKYAFSDTFLYRVNKIDNFLLVRLNAEGYLKRYSYDYKIPDIAIEEKRSLWPYALGFFGGIATMYLASKIVR